MKCSLSVDLWLGLAEEILRGWPPASGLGWQVILADLKGEPERRSGPRSISWSHPNDPTAQVHGELGSRTFPNVGRGMAETSWRPRGLLAPRDVRDVVGGRDVSRVCRSAAGVRDRGPVQLLLGGEDAPGGGLDAGALRGIGEHRGLQCGRGGGQAGGFEQDVVAGP